MPFILFEQAGAPEATAAAPTAAAPAPPPPRLDSTLSSAEAEVYDRQIRLWGVDAQQRMRDSRVLVSGMGALGAEIAKNLVLSGVSVTALDGAVVAPADVGVQFFLRAAHVGHNASLPAVQELNPLVSVACETRRIADMSDAELGRHALVVLTSSPPAEWVVTARRLRRLKVPIIAAQLFGFNAFAFFDFGDVKWTKEQKKDPKPATAKRGPRPGRTILVQGATRYRALDDVLAAPLAVGPRALSRMPFLPAALAWLGFMAHFSSSGGADAAAAALATPGGLRAGADEATAAATDAVASLAQRYGTAATRGALVNAARVRELMEQHGVELAAVAAIVGGMLCSEVVKLLTSFGDPIVNVLAFQCERSGMGAAAM